MSKKIGNSIDLNFHELLQGRIENVGSLSGSLGPDQAGYVVYYSNLLWLWTGSAWVSWGSVDWGNINGVLANQTDLQEALDGKEDSIGAKGTAFNTDFGTTAGTTSEGNHEHSNYVADADFTGKGVILVGTGSGTFEALTPGADGTILQRDDAQPSGFKFVPMPGVSSGNSPNFGKKTADTTRTTSQTTLITDSDFTLPVVKNVWYEIHLRIVLYKSEGLGQKIRMQLNLPVTLPEDIQGEWDGFAAGNGVTGANYMYGAAGLDLHYGRLITQEFDLDAQRDEAPTIYKLSGSFMTDTDGDMELKWGLRIPGNVNVNMKAGSYVRLIQM